MVNLRRIDLNLLVVLDALLAERSATRAGLRLGLTQPAVSAALARLRGHFDDPLMIRTPRGLEPTARALGLAAPLRAVLRDVEGLLEARGAFDPLALSREFRLGLGDYAAHVLLPDLLARLASEAPGVDLLVVDRVSRTNAADLLTRGEIDVAMTVGPAPSAQITVEPLFEDGWVLAARSGHPIWADEVTAAALAAWPALLVSPEGERYGITDRLLEEVGLRRRVALTLPQFLVAPSALAASDLVALLPTRLARALGGPHDLRTAEPPFSSGPRFRVSLAWHRRDAEDPAHAWLRTALRTAAHASTEP